MRTETRLRAERIRRGLTLVGLSQLTGIAPGDISQVELAKRPAFRGWRARLAKALAVDEDTLFADRD